MVLRECCVYCLVRGSIRLGRSSAPQVGPGGRARRGRSSRGLPSALLGAALRGSALRRDYTRRRVDPVITMPMRMPGGILIGIVGLLPKSPWSLRRTPQFCLPACPMIAHAPGGLQEGNHMVWPEVASGGDSRGRGGTTVAGYRGVHQAPPGRVSSSWPRASKSSSSWKAPCRTAEHRPAFSLDYEDMEATGWRDYCG